MFDIFDALYLIGGLCLFLFGMNVMGDGLERRSGNSLKSLLGKLTNNKFKGFLTGVGVTAVIQSSSATTVMVVGFVNSKVMTLKQSIGVIMGANIGTTITSWILSLSGISSDNIVIQLLKPMSFTPILALVGIILVMFSKSSKKRDTGTILLGFATLMFGMNAMSDAVSGLKDVQEFQNLFLAFKNPILGVIVGAVLTAVIQSSSASVGILQTLSVTGAVSYSATIPIIMGQNIGTCVTAMLSSFGANKNAKRASVVHLLFNVVGAVIWLVVFCIISAVFHPAILDESASYLGIAVCHTLFNVLCAALLLPASSLLEKLAYVIVPEGKSPDKVVELDERLLATPAIAVEQSSQLASKMANECIEAFQLSLQAIANYTPEIADKIRQLESSTDHYEDILCTYLTKLSQSQVSDEDSAVITKLLKAVGDFERIADHAVNILESVEELREKDVAFSAVAQKEMAVLCSAINEIISLTGRAFADNDVTLAYDVEPLEQVIDNLRTILRDNHIARLKDGACSVETGFVWSDLITNLERVSDHCSNIAVGIIDVSEHTMNAHEFIKAIKGSNSNYSDKYEEYSKKYNISKLA